MEIVKPFIMVSEEESNERLKNAQEKRDAWIKSIKNECNMASISIPANAIISEPVNALAQYVPDKAMRIKYSNSPDKKNLFKNFMHKAFKFLNNNIDVTLLGKKVTPDSVVTPAQDYLKNMPISLKIGSLDLSLKGKSDKDILDLEHIKKY